MALDLYGGAPVNNSGIDPIQGFDFECWAQDTHTGSIAFFGRFQSLTLSVRDATETYLELGQRIPIYLNGEIQIAWVLEQGLVDMAFVARTFGVSKIRRDQLVGRGPRFHIAFDANAAGRVNQTADSIDNLSRTRLGDGNSRANFDTETAGFESFFEGAQTGGEVKSDKPTGSGRYELMRCKVDSVSLGIMPGRRVAAVRWEGVSEGITFYSESVQTFKSNVGIGGAVVNSAINA